MAKAKDKTTQIKVPAHKWLNVDNTVIGVWRAIHFIALV